MKTGKPRVPLLSARSGAGHLCAAPALEKAFFMETDKHMAAADLIKAGGLTMALIEPIPGQEEPNPDPLLEAGAAIRSNNLPRAAWKIATLL
jgi:hypothetical protein